MSIVRNALSFVVISGLAALAACGGSAAPGVSTDQELPPAAPQQMTMELSASVVAHVLDFGVVTPNTDAMQVGDKVGDFSSRGLLRFDLGGLPRDVEIVSALLVLQHADGRGIPYGLGRLRVQHVDLGTGPTPADYDAAPLTELGVLSDAPGFGERTLDIARAVTADLSAGRDTTDVRVYFVRETDSDNRDDYVELFGPKLVITYQGQ